MAITFRATGTPRVIRWLSFWAWAPLLLVLCLLCAIQITEGRSVLPLALLSIVIGIGCIALLLWARHPGYMWYFTLGGAHRVLGSPDARTLVMPWSQIQAVSSRGRIICCTRSQHWLGPLRIFTELDATRVAAIANEIDAMRQRSSERQGASLSGGLQIFGGRWGEPPPACEVCGALDVLDELPNRCAVCSAATPRH